MDAAPYAHITQGPAIVQPTGPAVITAPRRGINPLIPIIGIGLVLFLIAATIILSLIPTYLSTRNIDPVDSYRYNTVYQINNGFLPIGALSADNCATIQTDQQALSGSIRGTSSPTVTVISCAIVGNNTDSGRRRRAVLQPKGNFISINGRATGNGICLRGACLQQRVARFIELLLNRGSFVLTLVGAQYSLKVISATILPTETPDLTNDLAILNYALVLEQLEANFYTQFQAQFTGQNFIAAGFTQTTYDYFNIIYFHELAHVRALTAVISQLGGTPVSQCTYNFAAVTDVKSYVSVAQALENTGAMAYDGAVNGIANPMIRKTAATIATVEARHAAYLNTLNGASPFPNTVENATVPALVIAAIQKFLISCPFTITPPTVPYIGSSSFTGTVPTSNDTKVSPYTSAMYTNDMKVLNYALVAENLEAAYYNKYVSTYSSTDYTNNGFPDASIYFILIREHENAHVQILQTVIKQRGGSPVSVCTYTFPVTDIRSFISLSRTFENTGVSAYTGAIDKIRDPSIILAAATIATVEARHASYLNSLLGGVPFPDVTDTPIEPTQIAATLAQFQTCPFSSDLILPV
ncbi:unnamed protein product [Adineta steineri]|uniref:Ferritin-like domain-containing protein n=1 Tax=Adineta steineri TaxID=433720 RepID=A0A815DZV2_9BILA|nr:unnamed protein product [Adineta steineri]CAF4079913.1 unnamed protein product [Adineta steineri]